MEDKKQTTENSDVIVTGEKAKLALDASQPAGQIKQYEALPADLKYFLHTHQAQCRAWAASHGNVNFPIVKDERTGQWSWVNREQRRRFRKFGTKSGKRL